MPRRPKIPHGAAVASGVPITKRPKPPRRPGKGGGKSRPPGFLFDDIDAQAEAEADRIVNELLAELGLARDSARRDAERSAQQEMERARAYSEALTRLGIPAQIQDIYGRSAGSIGQLAQGFSSEVQGIANAQGAEQANMVSGTGQEGAVRNAGVGMGDVLYGTEGYIPARSLEQMGSAFASQAALQPGFALQFGQQNASNVMQDFIDEVLPEFTDKETEIRMKRSGLVADAKERRKQEVMERYKMGFATQREVARALGVKDWRKYPNTPLTEQTERPKASASLSKAVGYLVDEYGAPILNRKGKVIPLPKDPAKLERFGNAQSGYWVMDPNTGEIHNIIPPVAPAPKAQKGYQLKTLKDGSTAVFDPNSGQVTVIAPPPKGSGKRQLTPAQRARYRGMATEFAQNAFEGVDPDENGQGGAPALSLARALEELKKTPIPWNLGKSILIAYYRKQWERISGVPQKGPAGGYPGKGKPPKGGKKKTVSAGGASLVPSLRGLMGHALSLGFTNLGTHNPSSRLPGGGVSDHAKWPAEAFDIGGFSGGWGNAKARRLFYWLIAQPGVKYVILGDKIWSRARGLHAYTSGGHETHIHVSGYGGGEA